MAHPQFRSAQMGEFNQFPSSNRNMVSFILSMFSSKFLELIFYLSIIIIIVGIVIIIGMPLDPTTRY